MNGTRGIELCSGLDCALVLSRPYRAVENCLVTITWGFARSFTPGCHMTGFQPSPGRCALPLEACRKEEASNKPRSPRFRGGGSGEMLKPVCPFNAGLARAGLLSVLWPDPVTERLLLSAPLGPDAKIRNCQPAPDAPVLPVCRAVPSRNRRGSASLRRFAARCQDVPSAQSRVAPS